MAGPLALVGGGEWTEGCTFDRDLLARSGGTEVVVVPAGLAYENPDRALARARAWFEGLGATVRALDVLRRPDAMVEEHVAAVRQASFVYLPGTSPMHLRSVLKDSPLHDALAEAWAGGAVLAGSGAGADVLCDPMVDTRGGAFTVGLGLVAGVAVIPRFNRWSADTVRRTVEMAPAGVVLVGLPEATALLRDEDGWRCEGVGSCEVYVAGRPGTLADLPA
jgi:cyanophycinase